jgi:hypothetical protein
MPQEGAKLIRCRPLFFGFLLVRLGGLPQCSENAPQTCIDKTEGDLVPEAEVKWLNIEKNSVRSLVFWEICPAKQKTMWLGPVWVLQEG